MKPPVRARLKTYSHLAGARRIPTAYEVASTRLAWHTERGVGIATPFAARFERDGRGGTLVALDWEAFADPRHTTYAGYVDLMARREAFVEQLFARIEETEPGGEAAAWLETVLSPLRYPIHALQMLAAYVGQIAPAGRITITCAFQAADELRRVQHVAYRLALLGGHAAAADGRERWQRDPSWQPLRRVIEKMLVAWDFGEAFAALNLCLKPAFDDLVNVRFARRAAAAGDRLFAEVLGSLDADARWHREWSAALVAVVVGQRPENQAVLDRHIARWRAPCADAIDALAEGMA